MAIGELLLNENLWVALSFVVFVALVWKKAGTALGSMFDKRAEEIKTNLDEARSLREEAQAELNKYQRMNREAADDAEKIVANAKKAAEKIRADAEVAAEASIMRKEEQATAKINALQAEVVGELRSRAAELATAAAAVLISGKLDKKASATLVKSDVDKIRKLK
jgi:F-type H+-transporting ATPase subunit b